jgi:predicted branched-subunit amino acid permease
MRAAIWLHLFVEGFRALLPLWLGAAPFALAYAVAARAAGLNVAETQLMSLTVFSAGAQLSAAGLLHAGASSVALLTTTLVLNIYQLMIGFSLGQMLPLSRVQRAIAAYFLTDSAYGVTVSGGAYAFPFLLGAELSMFVVWNVCTFIGAIAGQLLRDPASLGLDFVFPLTFLALLIPLLRTRADLLTALCTGMIALIAGRVVASSVAVLLAAVLGSLAGAWLRPAHREPTK